MLDERARVDMAAAAHRQELELGARVGGLCKTLELRGHEALGCHQLQPLPMCPNAAASPEAPYCKLVHQIKA